jgi:N-acetylglucosamine kinase-like BadF-type ATPase
VPSVLAIDMGRTGCRAALWNDDSGTPTATATGDGSLGLGASHGASVALEAILAVIKPLLRAHAAHHVDAIGVGVPGAMGAPEAARQLAQRLVESLSVGVVSVTSDAITSHAGALADEPGVVLAAGTGVVAIAVGADRRFRRVDGFGPWLGDEGSGAWLGRRGLQAVARASDGRGPATSLANAMAQQFGSIAQLATRLGSDPNPARVLASFAPAVADAARTGDAEAQRLLDACAATLAESVLAAARALDSAEPVATVILGGLTNMGPVLLDPLHAALARGGIPLRLQPARGTALDGARRLALSDDGIHAPWIIRSHATSSPTSTRTPANHP